MTNKSPNELFSFFHHCFHNYVHGTAKQLLRFGDGVARQNKNNTLVRFFLNMCNRGQFDTHTHYYSGVLFSCVHTGEIRLKGTIRSGLFSIHEVQTDKFLKHFEFQKLVATLIQENHQLRRNFRKRYLGGT